MYCGTTSLIVSEPAQPLDRSSGLSGAVPPARGKTTHRILLRSAHTYLPAAVSAPGDRGPPRPCMSASAAASFAAATLTNNYASGACTALLSACLVVDAPVTLALQSRASRSCCGTSASPSRMRSSTSGGA
jgi:hypothetical protein